MAPFESGRDQTPDEAYATLPAIKSAACLRRTLRSKISKTGRTVRGHLSQFACGGFVQFNKVTTLRNS